MQRSDLISKAELDEQCRTVLVAIVAGVKTVGPIDTAGTGWDTARELFQSISASRARQGFTPADVATYVLSLKQPLFAAIRRSLKGNQDELFDTISAATDLLDRLAMITIEAYIATREELIMRQQQELLELSTPVVKLWDGILALPIIGTLDSSRTQMVMESLLQTVVATNTK